MNGYLFVLHCFNNDKGGKNVYSRSEWIQLPALTFSVHMDAVLADTGSAVTFERLKAKRPSRK